jgi:hypothetical protein
MSLGLTVRRVGIAVALVAAVALVPASGGAPADVPRVSLIGDSIADAFAHNADATRLLGRGIDLRLEVAPCRRIAPESCPADNGVRPPTVLDLVQDRGAALGPTVIVAVGYNDFEDEYPGNIEAALAALDKAGVRRVLWPTLRAARHPYLTMNDAIKAAAARHPEMTVVDWNVYSRSHPDWFQDDGIHLNVVGVGWMATLFRRALLDLKIPLPPVVVATARLPDARLGRAYASQLVARGGLAPYRWSFKRLPAGVHASAAGRLSGAPRGRAGTYAVSVRVVDALGDAVTRVFRLRVRPR